MTQVALAPCSPFSVTPRLMRESAALAERRDCRLHTHLAETKDEDAYCAEVYGCRPIELLEQVGWLGPRTWLAHGVMSGAFFTSQPCASGIRIAAHAKKQRNFGNFINNWMEQ